MMNNMDNLNIFIATPCYNGQLYSFYRIINKHYKFIHFYEYKT